MPKKPKKTVKVVNLETLLRDWTERLQFCVIESDKYPAASYARREWSARSSAAARCINELREVLA